MKLIPKTAEIETVAITSISPSATVIATVIMADGSEKQLSVPSSAVPGDFVVLDSAGDLPVEPLIEGTSFLAAATVAADYMQVQ